MRKHTVLTLFGFLLVLVPSSKAACADQKTCQTCTSKSSWIGASCRWCPWTSSCHTYGSLVNKCKAAANIADKAQCSTGLEPSGRTDNGLCPNGQLPSVQGPRPGADGCSGVSDCPAGFCFKDCCDQHDFCYQTCQPTGGKEECDNAFHRCMTNVCDKVAEEDRLACELWALTYYVGVDTLRQAGQAYNKRQFQVCLCPPAATSDENSMFSAGYFSTFPTYAWIVFGIAIFVVVVSIIGIAYGIYKFKQRSSEEETV